MRLEPSRRLVLSLSLGVLLSLGAVLPVAAAAVSTLTSEGLIGHSPEGTLPPLETSLS